MEPMRHTHLTRMLLSTRTTRSRQRDRTTSASADCAPNKTQQKISGRLTSDDTTQDRLDIRSYIDTARKHGQDVFDVLHALFTGSPWTPPVPGQA